MTVTGFIIFTGIFVWQFAKARHPYPDDIFSNLNLTDFLSKERKYMQRFCTTEACQKSARDILESINPAIDPCDDFYTYACGGWIQKHPVPLTENQWNQFDILDKRLDSQIHELLKADYEDADPEIVKAAKKTFRVCMDTDRIEKKGLKPLLNLLEEFGGWPMASLTWDERKFDWQKLASDVTRELALSTILLIYVNADRKNTSRNVMIVDEPDLGLSRYMLTDPDQGYIEPYVTYMSEAAELLGTAKDGRFSHRTLRNLYGRSGRYGGKSFREIFSLGLISECFMVIKFETELAKIMRNEEEKRNADDMYNLVTIRKLQEWTDERSLLDSKSRINWKSFVKNILGPSGGEVGDDTPIVVTDWQFLNKLIKLIDVTPPRVLADYILWRVVKAMSRDLNEEMMSLNFNFKRKLSAVKEDYPRWRDCVLAAGHLSFAVGYMYVKHHFNGDDKAKAVEMVEDIRTAFKQELSEVPWMDAETKKQAIEKADFMNHFIGYPKWFENVTFLEEYYNGVKVGDNHFKNKLNLRRFLSRKMWADWNVETNRDEWVASPAIANAFYNPQLNSIIFPAGVLQNPFFDKDQPEALNYGSIGAVVGHEITHGFDALGRQSDKLGNIKQWWSRETEKTYLENTLCFINQYRSYRIPELDAVLNTEVTMNGLLTLDENIADNGGLRAALRAYQSHREKSRRGDLVLPGLDFTPEQLFYIGFARVWCESHTTDSLLGEVLAGSHSPHRLRVIGSVSNSEHFATTWQCKLGSNMNPVEKCKLW